MRVHGFILFAFLASSIAPSAHAEADPRAEARSHYERGIALAERRSYDEALVEFRRAYEQSPHFAVLYNIGLCHMALERSTEALDAFRRYLAEGGAEIPPDRRVQVEVQIAELESRFAELTITADRPGTVVAIDGKELGRTPLARPIRVPPGAHEISATLDGVPVLNRRIQLAASERRTIDVAFAPATVSAGPPSSASATPPALELQSPPSREKPAEFGPLRTLGFVLTGAGVATGIGGAVHYAWNRGRHADWEAEQARLGAEPPPLDYRARAIANNELADSIERASAVTVGLFVASGVLIAGGATIIVVDPGGGANVAWSGTW